MWVATIGQQINQYGGQTQGYDYFLVPFQKEYTLWFSDMPKLQRNIDIKTPVTICRTSYQQAMNSSTQCDVLVGENL